MNKVISQNHCARCKKISIFLIKNATFKLKTGEIKHSFVCRKCCADRARKYRKTKRGKEVYRDIMRRQYLNHSEKVLARQSLNYALRMGKIGKPKSCSVCKKSKKLEAHHTDYRKPLCVQWVCRQCHFDV